MSSGSQPDAHTPTPKGSARQRAVTPRPVAADGNLPSSTTETRLLPVIMPPPQAEPGSSAKHVAVGYGRLVMRRFRIGTDWQGRPPHFSVIGLLGQGGMGVVDEVRQTSCDRVVALKRLRTDVRLRDGETQLLVEAAVTASLEHPCIPAVYDIGLTEQRIPFYVMRKLSGQPWSQRMPAMTLADNLQVLLRISEAVDYAHGQGVLHRDIKPENVMLGDFGEVMLVDWGFAAQASDAPNGGHRHAPAITHLNAMSGSPRWMPPEVARGEIAAIGIRSDVYLLGAVLRWILSGQRPHPGTTAQECIIAASDNRFAGELPPGPLAELAAQATSSRPSSRPANVSRFLERLREAMRALEAGRLIAAARQRSADGDHHAYLHAESLMQQAIALSANDPAATQALRDLRLGRAERALGSGDLALAAELAVNVGQDSEIEALRLRIQEAQRRRSRRRRVTAVLAACVAVLAAVGAYVQTGQWLDRQRQWREVAIWPAGTAASQLSLPSGEKAQEHDGVVLLRPRLLYALHGDYPSGDLRIEMEACWRGGIDGLEIGFGARLSGQGASLPWGYAGQVAGYAGASTFLARIAADRPASIADGVECPFVAGQWYQIAFERSEDELRVVIDGTVVFRHVDPLPPPVQERGIFLRSWSDSLQLRGLAITRLGHPAQATPLVAVDALAQAGQLEEAVREAVRIAEDVGQGELAFRAAAKACLLAVALPAEQRAALTAAVRHRLQSQAEAGRWWSAVLEADATAAWLAGDHAGAISVAERAQQADPDSRTAIGLLALPRHRLAPAEALRLLTMLVRTPGVAALDLSHLGLEDLAPLARCRISRLSLSGNPLSDITPLAGLPLTHLDLSHTRISEITPLRGAPLQFLSLSGTGVAELAPLRGAPLRTLICDRSQVADLTPVGDCPIEMLQASSTPLADLRPLGGQIRQTLVELNIGSSQVRDLAPLAAVRGLRLLSMERTAVADLSPLAGLPLQNLNCDGSLVSDLAPLRGTPLVELRCAETRVSDLGPLAQIPVQVLGVSKSPVSDLAPLASTPLRGLGIAGCPVSDLRPLPATVQEIQAWDTPIAFPPAHRVRLLAHGWPQLDDAAWQAGLAAWIAQPADAGAVRVMRTMRCMAIGDLDGLRQLSVAHAGRRLLHLPVPLPLAPAEAWAVRLGGSLYAVPPGPVDDFVVGLIPSSPLRQGRRLWSNLRINEALRMVNPAGQVHDQVARPGALPGQAVYLAGRPSPGFIGAASETGTTCEVLVDLGAASAP
jgi:serine/threonine protein kinase